MPREESAERRTSVRSPRTDAAALEPLAATRSREGGRRASSPARAASRDDAERRRKENPLHAAKLLLDEERDDLDALHARALRVRHRRTFARPTSPPGRPALPLLIRRQRLVVVPLVPGRAALVGRDRVQEVKARAAQDGGRLAGELVVDRVQLARVEAAQAAARREERTREEGRERVGRDKVQEGVRARVDGRRGEGGRVRRVQVAAGARVASVEALHEGRERARETVSTHRTSSSVQMCSLLP